MLARKFEQNIRDQSRLIRALIALSLIALPTAQASAATPAFSVHKNGTAQTVVGDTPTKLTWSTEILDTNANFASDRFTPTIAGNYLIVVSVQCAQPGACIPSIYKNGTLYAASRITNQTFADQSPQASAIVSMNGTTDYVEAFATSSGNSIGGVATQTYFSGSQIDGTGTGTSQWVDGSSGSIYYNGGNVGIGTAAPTSKLHVAGGIVGISGSAAPGLLVKPTSGSEYIFGANTALAGAGIYDNTATAWRLVVQDTTGNVGIGNATPLQKLSVSGTIGISEAAGGGDRLRISTSSSGAVINQNDNSPIYLQTQGNTALSISTNGNIGIGTTSPATKLDVNGGINTNSLITLNASAAATSIGYLQWYRGTSRVAFMGYGQNAGPTWGNRLDIAVENGAYLGITGNVSVNLGTVAPSYSIHAGGQVAGAGAYVNTSDARLKTDVNDLDYGIDTVMRLRPVTFKWKTLTEDWQKGRKLGLIAQEAEKVAPEIVSTANDPEHTKSIAYGDLTPILVKAVQELKADNDNLRAELRETIISQDAEIESLRRELKALQAGR